MHFRVQATKQRALGQAPSFGSSTTLESKYSSSTTLVVASEIESQEGDRGVSCWDFAYPSGKCSSLPLNSSCDCSKDKRSKCSPSVYCHATASTYEKSREQSQQKNKKQSKHVPDKAGTKTYLLSSPTSISITYPQTKTTISALLSQPNTRVIYLVPQSNIVCPIVCALMRLPRAYGSSFQVLPVPTEIDMKCGGEGRCWFADIAAVEEIVQKVLKNTKTRSFDGYISFEEERDAWTFLERIGQRVKAAPTKG